MTGSLFPASTCESGLGEDLESNNGLCFLNSAFSLCSSIHSSLLSTALKHQGPSQSQPLSLISEGLRVQAADQIVLVQTLTPASICCDLGKVTWLPENTQNPIHRVRWLELCRTNISIWKLLRCIVYQVIWFIKVSSSLATQFSSLEEISITSSQCILSEGCVIIRYTQVNSQIYHL